MLVDRGRRAPGRMGVRAARRRWTRRRSRRRCARSSPPGSMRCPAPSAACSCPPRSSAAGSIPTPWPRSAGWRAAEARERIAALIRRELVTVDDEPRSPGRGQLSFVQEVVRDVAYSTVSLRDRRTLHLAAADHLEALRDDELVEAIAEHLVAAHGAAPDHAEAPVVARRAVGALRLAAARALALRVPDAGTDAPAARARARATTRATRAVLWQEAAVAARAAARFDLAEEFLRRLFDWQEAARGATWKPPARRAQLASLLLATERHGSALGDLEAALDGVADLGSDASSVELSGQLARAHVLVGERSARARLGEPHPGRLRAPRPLGGRVDALITRGTAQMRLGNDAAGLADLHAAIADAQRPRPHRCRAAGPEQPCLAGRARRPPGDAGDGSRRAGAGNTDGGRRHGTPARATWSAVSRSIQATGTRPCRSSTTCAIDRRRRRIASSSPSTRRRCAHCGAIRVPEPCSTHSSRWTPTRSPRSWPSIDHARAWIAFVDGRLEDAHRTGRRRPAIDHSARTGTPPWSSQRVPPCGSATGRGWRR